MAIQYDPITGESIEFQPYQAPDPYRVDAIKNMIDAEIAASESGKLTTPNPWEQRKRKDRSGALSYRLPGYSEENPYATGNKFADISQNVILPLLAVAEVIGSKGKSKGETALSAAQTLAAGKVSRLGEAKAYETKLQEKQKREAVKGSTPETIEDVIKEYYPDEYIKSKFIKVGGKGIDELQAEVKRSLPALRKIYPGNDGSLDPLIELISSSQDPELLEELLKSTYRGVPYIGRDITRQKSLAPLRTQEKIEAQQALAPGEVEIAAQRAMATKLADAAASREGNVLSETQSTSRGQNYTIMSGLSTLADAVESGNVGFWDTTPVGSFKNPGVANAIRQARQGVGRRESGAAISSREWSEFQAMLLNRNFLLSDEGQKVVLSNLEDFIRRIHMQGMSADGDPSWYSKMKETDISQYRNQELKDFPTEEAARAAGFENGDRVKINGVSGILE